MTDPAMATETGTETAEIDAAAEIAALTRRVAQLEQDFSTIQDRLRAQEIQHDGVVNALHNWSRGTVAPVPSAQFAVDGDDG